ncbi:hypothetical protein GALMADRAFT_234326 [Galerina marginata CBS 339.88]|uniref:Uncharacterized protein n=1 Tax=Galerina marginata (strain CBS 339.88) TaxID=685588 RepID=A0A067TT39_GALM3|nr:hypothetical protein GALMADRAFT_234326 [Galerina marginata CBS 339.88]
MSSSNKIFNVEEVTGKDRVTLETTAAEAKIDAPNPVIAHQVEVNAEEAQEAANQAAAHAKMMGTSLTGEPKTAVGQLRGDAAKTTNAAVAEGKRDVDEAKAVGAGYVEQAKALASSAIETAQSYLPSTIAGKPVGEAASDVASTVQQKAGEAYTVAKETAQPHIEKAISAAQGYYAGTQGLQEHGEAKSIVTPASSTGIPAATTAPLESGPYTTTTPYPTGMETKIASADAAKESTPTASRN